MLPYFMNIIELLYMWIDFKAYDSCYHLMYIIELLCNRITIAWIQLQMVKWFHDKHCRAWFICLMCLLTKTLKRHQSFIMSFLDNTIVDSKVSLNYKDMWFQISGYRWRQCKIYFDDIWLYTGIILQDRLW